MEEYNNKALNSIDFIKIDNSKEKLMTLFKILQQRQY